MSESDATVQPASDIRDVLGAEIDKLSIAENLSETPAETTAIEDDSQNVEEVENNESSDGVKVEKKDLAKLGFTKDEVSKLETLSDDVKEALEARDTRYLNGVNKLKAQVDVAKPLMQALQPHSEYLSALQVTPEDFIPALVNTEMVLRLGSQEQKISKLQQIAHEYGVDLNLALQQPFDPRLAQLQAEKDLLTRQVQKNTVLQQDAEQETLIESIEQWAQDKPYFHEVREDMALLLEAGKATDLDDAYNKAQRLNDKIYKKSILLQNNKAAQEAKKTAIQVNGSPTGAGSLPKLETTTDRVRYAMSKHGF